MNLSIWDKLEIPKLYSWKYNNIPQADWNKQSYFNKKYLLDQSDSPGCGDWGLCDISISFPSRTKAQHMHRADIYRELFLRLSPVHMSLS